MLLSYCRRHTDNMTPRVLEALGATSLLVAALCVFRLLEVADEDGLSDAISYNISSLTSELMETSLHAFLQTGWDIVRVTSCRSLEHPGGEWSLLVGNDVVVGQNSRLQVKYLEPKSDTTFIEAPIAHPCWKSPGSVWHKFMRNELCHIFSGRNAKIQVQFPLVADLLSHEVEDQYRKAVGDPSNPTLDASEEELVDASLVRVPFLTCWINL